MGEVGTCGLATMVPGMGAGHVAGRTAVPAPVASGVELEVEELDVEVAYMTMEVPLQRLHTVERMVATTGAESSPMGNLADRTALVLPSPREEARQTGMPDVAVVARPIGASKHRRRGEFRSGSSTVAVEVAGEADPWSMPQHFHFQASHSPSVVLVDTPPDSRSAMHPSLRQLDTYRFW